MTLNFLSSRAECPGSLTRRENPITIFEGMGDRRGGGEGGGEEGGKTGRIGGGGGVSFITEMGRGQTDGTVINTSPPLPPAAASRRRIPPSSLANDEAAAR